MVIFQLITVLLSLNNQTVDCLICILPYNYIVDSSKIVAKMPVLENPFLHIKNGLYNVLMVFVISICVSAHSKNVNFRICSLSGWFDELLRMNPKKGTINISINIPYKYKDNTFSSCAMWDQRGYDVILANKYGYLQLTHESQIL